MYGWCRLVSRLIAGCLCAAMLAACGSDSDPEAAKGSSNKIRMAAVKEAALTYGAQYGLAWRAEAINNITDKYAITLDQIYDFNRMLLPHHLLPPVLVEVSDSMSLSAENTIRLSDRTVEIRRPAVFVTTVPSWRDYIHMNFHKPGRPNASVLPVNDEERLVWDRYVQVGWQKGIDQAEAILDTNLARLDAQYEGMILYHKLLAENMISKPFVAKAALGNTGNASRMRLNDRVVRITRPSMLNTKNDEAWEPILIVEEDAPATAAPTGKGSASPKGGLPAKGA